MRLRTALVFCIAMALAAVATRADVPPETVGHQVTLPQQPGPHWFWLSDILLHRTALFDADRGEQLGVITAGTPGVGFVVAPLFAANQREIYLAESYYSRGVRGERTDVVTVYDGRNLEPLAEIPIPPKRAEYFPGNAANALSDDGRFMAVFNLTPATSLSIVDVQARAFKTEVQTPGCSLVFAAGPRRFLMLCADGAALVVEVAEDGTSATVNRTAAFFDPQKDPLTEKAVRRGDTWLFVSFEGVIHPVDVGGPAITFGETWSLLGAAERTDEWRIGGAQHLAVHEATGRLYALMHQGGVDTHKDAGTEVWVYDLATKARTATFPIPNPLVSFVRQSGGLDPESTLDGFAAWLLEAVLPHTGADRILVTQGDAPVLLISASIPPTVTVHDAGTGAMVRDIAEVGIASSLLYAP
jgi:methylamine dehydrogenase heavy chain